MGIIAAGARIDPIAGLQVVVVILEEDLFGAGILGQKEHIYTHILQAAVLGHTWINIPANIYSTFRNGEELTAYLEQQYKPPPSLFIYRNPYWDARLRR